MAMAMADKTHHADSVSLSSSLAGPTNLFETTTKHGTSWEKKDRMISVP
jgi:hypothetical protein